MTAASIATSTPPELCGGKRRNAGAGPLTPAVLASAAFALIAADGAAWAGTLGFEHVFDTYGEPRRLHYRATYGAAGGVRRLEVWRDGQRRLKRATDGVIATFATRWTGPPEFQLAVPARRCRVLTDANKDIGND